LAVAATVLAALIGAVIGSLGAVLVEARVKRRAEEAARREILMRRYLFQLQDAAESLWFRLYNLNERGGRYVMSDEYFATTTMYALGRVLAIERILGLEGIYPELEALYPELGEFLKGNRLDPKLAETVYQYHRLALAEAMIEREEDGFRPSTYLEFRRRYESSEYGEQKWLAPALEGIRSLEKETVEELMSSLQTIALRLESETRIPTAIPIETDASASVIPAGGVVTGVDYDVTIDRSDAAMGVRIKRLGGRHGRADAEREESE
jgi:hypothetical protein